MTCPSEAELIEEAQAFVDRKYVARADARQKVMGLAYVEAERVDLAKEIARFTARALTRAEGGKGEAPRDVGLENQFLAQLEGLAIGLEQQGEKSGAHLVRRAHQALTAPSQPASAPRHGQFHHVTQEEKDTCPTCHADYAPITVRASTHEGKAEPVARKQCALVRVRNWAERDGFWECKPCGILEGYFRGYCNDPPAQPAPAADAIGWWLSAALNDPNTCDEFKRDIEAWFAAGQPLPALAGKREAIARIIYDAFPFTPLIANTSHKPAWVKGGNSLAQDEARRAVDAILALLPLSRPSPDNTKLARELRACDPFRDSLYAIESLLHRAADCLEALSAQGEK